MMFAGGRRFGEEPEGPYGEDALRVDREICRLVAERDRLAAGERLHPGAARLLEWSKEFGVGELSLRNLFAQLAATPRLEALPPTPEGLRRVLEVMRRVERDGLAVTLTHCMQYRNASVIHCEIEAPGYRIPHGSVLLEVEGTGYESRHHHAQGGGGKWSAAFVVWPALPDDLRAVTFILRQGVAMEPPVETPLEIGAPLVFGPAQK